MLGLDVGDTSGVLKGTDFEALAAIADASAVFTASGTTGSALASNGSTANRAELVSGVVVKHETVTDTTNLEQLSIRVRLDDGRLATLAHTHIADFSEFASALGASARFAVGARLESAVVLSSFSRSGVVITMKPLLLTVAKGVFGANEADDLPVSFPCRVADLAPGQILAGVVWKVDTYGVMVRFRDNLTALAPRPSIADRFVASPLGLFNVGDSVRCAVQRVDLVSERVIVTLKPSLVFSSRGNSCFLSSLLRERYLAAVGTSVGDAIQSGNSFESFPDWQKYPLGSLASVTVTAIKSYGIVFLGDDQTTVLLAKGEHALSSSACIKHSKKSDFKIGEKVDVRILDIDIVNRILEVSCQSTLTASFQGESMVETSGSVDAASKGRKERKKGREGKAKNDLDRDVRCGSVDGLPVLVGSHVHARVEITQEKYLVVTVLSHVDNDNEGTSTGTRASLGTAYLMIADFHCPCESTSIYKSGDVLECVVVQASTRGNGSTFSATAQLEFPHERAVVLAIAQNRVTLKSIANSSNSSSSSALEVAGRERSNSNLSTSDIVAMGVENAVELRKKFLDSLRQGGKLKWVVVKVEPALLTLEPEFNELLGLKINATAHVSCAVNINNSLSLPHNSHTADSLEPPV